MESERDRWFLPGLCSAAALTATKNERETVLLADYMSQPKEIRWPM